MLTPPPRTQPPHLDISTQTTLVEHHQHIISTNIQTDNSTQTDPDTHIQLDNSTQTGTHVDVQHTATAFPHIDISTLHDKVNRKDKILEHLAASQLRHTLALEKVLGNHI